MKMNFNIAINDIIPGMVLYEDVIQGGNLLLPKGTVIKPNYIEQLVARGISNVKICAERSYNDFITNPVERFYAESYEDVAAIIDSLKSGSELNFDNVFALVGKIVGQVLTHKNSILLLTGFRRKCDYYYAHSLDVCIYSIITARAMNFEYDNIITLGLGALLHDIGKTSISDSLLLKQGSLTFEEYEIVKKHSEYGYKIIEKIPDINYSVAKIILQHHERCDGSGYPNKLKSNRIFHLSKIVAIADIYDALTSDKVYRSKVLPHEAAEYILCMSRSLVDYDIASIFLKNVAIYPIGCKVLLNTNEIAVVLDSNLQIPLRPFLRIITDRRKNPLKFPYEFELQAHPGVFIVHMFN